MRVRFDRLGAGILLAILSGGIHAAQADAPAEKPAAGRQAPSCTLQQFGSGQSRDLHAFSGKLLYVDFWASWCTSCRHSFSFMNTLHDELAGQGLEVVAINLDDNPADASAFLKKHPANFTILADPSMRCPAGFGIEGMPASYLIDRDGVIRFTHVGFRSGDADSLRRSVERLLAEAP